MKKKINNTQKVNKIKLKKTQEHMIPKRIIHLRNKAKAKLSKYAIFADDMHLIINSLDNKGKVYRNKKQEYCDIRDTIAHILLKFFAIKINQLGYFTFKNIEDLFKGKDLLIKGLKSPEDLDMVFPYVPEMNYFLNLIRPRYESFVNYYNWNIKRKYEEHIRKVEEKDTNKKPDALFSKDNIFISNINTKKSKNISDVWFINLENYTARLNRQLKSAFKNSEKTVTTQSYRRGSGQILANTKGLKTTAKYLNYKSISSADSYIKSKGETKRDWIEVYRIINITNKLDIL